MPVEALPPNPGPDDQGKNKNEEQNLGISFPPAAPRSMNEALRNILASDQEQYWKERRNTFMTKLDALEVRVDSDLRFYGLANDEGKK